MFNLLVSVATITQLQMWRQWLLLPYNCKLYPAPPPCVDSIPMKMGTTLGKLMNSERLSPSLVPVGSRNETTENMDASVQYMGMQNGSKLEVWRRGLLIQASKLKLWRSSWWSFPIIMFVEGIHTFAKQRYVSGRGHVHIWMWWPLPDLLKIAI